MRTGPFCCSYRMCQARLLNLLFELSTYWTWGETYSFQRAIEDRWWQLTEIIVWASWGATSGRASAFCTWPNESNCPIVLLLAERAYGKQPYSFGGSSKREEGWSLLRLHLLQILTSVPYLEALSFAVQYINSFTHIYRTKYTQRRQMLHSSRVQLQYAVRCLLPETELQLVWSTFQLSPSTTKLRNIFWLLEVFWSDTSVYCIVTLTDRLTALTMTPTLETRISFTAAY